MVSWTQFSTQIHHHFSLARATNLVYTKWILACKIPIFEPKAEPVHLHIEETPVVTLWEM
jgi:hypothetical protein